MLEDGGLLARRKFAAEASKGISGGPVREMALRMLANIENVSSILDFGGGTGDLLQHLYSIHQNAKLTGVDILPRNDLLPDGIDWFQQDLNEEFKHNRTFDVVISTEVIEHLENPRAFARNLHGLVKPNGYAIVTTPNQHSIRAITALIFGGHFAAFLGESYPAHITALTHKDLQRVFEECGFRTLGFDFSNSGGLPKLPSITWQKISFSCLHGSRFSDNVGAVFQKTDDSH